MSTPRWMRVSLLLAAAYNIAWGTFVIFFPRVPFAWLEMEPPHYIELWQCIGMMVGVYGVAYALAARDPLRYWPIVLAGLLGKILGPIGFLQAALGGNLPWRVGWTILTNDLIWWPPFVAILLGAYRRRTPLRL